MRTALLLCLAALLLAGCGKKPPPPAAQGPALVPNNSGGPVNPDLSGRTDVYQGQSADQWGQQLLDPRQSHTARYQAGVALSNLNDKGYKYLQAGLKSNAPEVRLQALQAMSAATMQANKNEMVPQMIDLLNDRNDAIRTQAAHRMGWFDQTTSTQIIPGPMALERVRALQQVYQFDSNREAQLAARNSLVQILFATRGKMDCPPGLEHLLGK